MKILLSSFMFEVCMVNQSTVYMNISHYYKLFNPG